MNESSMEGNKEVPLVKDFSYFKNLAKDAELPEDKQEAFEGLLATATTEEEATFIMNYAEKSTSPFSKTDNEKRVLELIEQIRHNNSAGITHRGMAA